MFHAPTCVGASSVLFAPPFGLRGTCGRPVGLGRALGAPEISTGKLARITVRD